MELVRAILLKVEASSTREPMDLVIPGYTAEEIYYHVMMLHKAALLEAVDFSSMDGNCWMARNLTWDGHEFIDALRNDTVWNKTKAFVLEKTGILTIEAMKQAVPIILKLLLDSQ